MENITTKNVVLERKDRLQESYEPQFPAASHGSKPLPYSEFAQLKGTSIGVEGVQSIILNAIAVLNDSSSSESDDEEDIIICERLRHSDNIYLKNAALLIAKNKRNCVKHYFERIVPTYFENEFRRHFRISRSLFESLSELLCQSEYYQNVCPGKRNSEKLYLLVFLWFAGHESCSYRDLADRFDLSFSTISLIIKRVSMFLSAMSPQIIKWTNSSEKEESSIFFDRKCFFSKVIGCINGTHVVIDPPPRGKDDYIDRKGRTSICLQGICNEKKKFINIFVGYPGSCHDSWVLKNSPIYQKLPSYCEDYYLLGDSAYPCSRFLVTPYRNNGHLTRKQMFFNKKLSSGRVVIEHTFGLLKQRFRQLYHCKLRGMGKICHFIRACCVLHNITKEDDINFGSEIIPEINENEYNEPGGISSGNAVRNSICDDIIRLYNLILN